MAKKKSRAEIRKERATKARERAKQRQMRSRGTATLDYTGDFWKPRTHATIAILPYEVTDPRHPEAEVGEEAYCRPYRVHRVPTIEGKTVKMVCPTSVGKPCPVCEHFGTLDWDTQKDEKRALKYSERELYNIYDHKDGKVYVFDYPYTWFGHQIVRETAEGDEEWGSFYFTDDLGFDLKTRWKETNINPDFLEIDRIDFIEREEGADIPKDVLAEVVNLDELLKIPTYAELEKAMWGAADDDEEQEEQEEEKQPARSRRTSRPEPESEDEGEDEDSSEEEPQPEEDEKKEEEKPKRRQRQRASKKKDEEENPCPFGHEFGADHGEHGVDCDKCDDATWDACADKKEELGG